MNTPRSQFVRLSIILLLGLVASGCVAKTLTTESKAAPIGALSNVDCATDLLVTASSDGRAGFKIDPEGRVTELADEGANGKWVDVALPAGVTAVAMVTVVGIDEDAPDNARCAALSTQNHVFQLPDRGTHDPLAAHWRVQIVADTKWPTKPKKLVDKDLDASLQASATADEYLTIATAWNLHPAVGANAATVDAFAKSAETLSVAGLSNALPGAQPAADALELIALGQLYNARRTPAAPTTPTSPPVPPTPPTPPPVLPDWQLEKQLTDKLNAFLLKARPAVRKNLTLPDECKAALQQAAVNAPEKLPGWMLGTFDLPMNDKEFTVLLRANKAVTIFYTTPMAALGTELPFDDKTEFLWDPGPSTEADPIRVIIRGLGLFPGFGLGASPALPNAKFTPQSLGVPPNSPPPSDACTLWATYLKDPVNNPLVLPPGVYPFRPIARFTSRVGLSQASGKGALQQSRDYTVSVCNGDCKETKNVRTSSTVSTPFGLGAALLGTVTYDFCPSGSCKDGIFTTYAWQPTRTAGPTQQLFEFTQAKDPGLGITGSIILAMMFPECSFGRFGLGAGPALVSGGVATGKQWTVNALFGPRWMERHYLFFTLGTGFRVDTEPVNLKPGQQAVLATGSSPPTPTTQTRYDAVVSLGIAINLSAPVGDIAPKIFGGGK